MKTDVLVTGIGIHPFGRHPDKSAIQLCARFSGKRSEAG